MPRADERARIRRTSLTSVWRFAAGMSATSIAGLLLYQADKVILSKMLPLAAFGYYSLAGMIAAGLQYFGNPIQTAFYPAFSRLHGMGDVEGLAEHYHKAAQTLSVAVLPVAGVMVFFSREVVLAWTMNVETTAATHPLARLLCLGTALNLLASIPYCLQLACGWTRLGFVANAVAVLLLLPLLPVAIHVQGATGAAAVWVLLNLGYVLFYVQALHRKVLHGEQRRWYFRDVIPPAAAVSAVAAAARLFSYDLSSRWLLLLQLGGVYLGMVVTAALVTGGIRAQVLGNLSRLKSYLATDPVR